MLNFVFKLVKKYERFIKFCLVGGMNAILAILIYNGLIFLGVHYIISNSAAFVLTVLNSFYWNKKHVFKTSAKGAQVKFFILYGANFLLSNAMLAILIQGFLLNKTIAQILVLGASTIINYSVNRLWVFRGR